MKALVKLKPEKGFWMQEIEKPAIGDQDVLIKIKKTAICGTDLHIYKWDAWAQKRVPLPLTVGHEFMGEIAAVGKDVKHLKVGDRISGEGHIVCGYCHNCRCGKEHLCPNTLGIGIQRNGAFAEFLAIPAHNVIPLPAEISDRVAAMLDPLGNAVHTVKAFDISGEDILITGAGPIGMMTTVIARHLGARNIVITDVNEFRLKMAKDLGATRTVLVGKGARDEVGDEKVGKEGKGVVKGEGNDADSKELDKKLESVRKELGILEGFAVGWELSGHEQALRLLLDQVSHGGGVALLGIPNQDFAIDWNKVIFKGLTLQGIYGRKMFETWETMIHMLQSGLEVEGVITHEFAAEDFDKAFEVVQKGEGGKVVLDWG